MRTCLISVALVVSAALGCSRNDGNRHSMAPAAEKPSARADLPTADLAQATISADGSPAEIVRGGSLTTTAGRDILVEGLVQLDPEADFKPSTAVIKIIRTRPDGTNVTMDSAIGELKREQQGVYGFRAVVTTPKKAGSYRIVGKFRGKTFSEGNLNVSM